MSILSFLSRTFTRNQENAMTDLSRLTAAVTAAAEKLPALTSQVAQVQAQNAELQTQLGQVQTQLASTQAALTQAQAGQVQQADLDALAAKLEAAEQAAAAHAADPNAPQGAQLTPTPVSPG